jgi:hypothetical protein
LWPRLTGLVGLGHNPTIRGGVAAVSARLRPTWITDVDDIDHVVTDDNMTVSLTAQTGTYRAICGADILPAPMSDAPSGRCFCCVATLRALRQRELQAAPPSPRKHCLLTRLFGQH